MMQIEWKAPATTQPQVIKVKVGKPETTVIKVVTVDTK